jgi:hypothetical protein
VVKVGVNRELSKEKVGILHPASTHHLQAKKEAAKIPFTQIN